MLYMLILTVSTCERSEDFFRSSPTTTLNDSISFSNKDMLHTSHCQHIQLLIELQTTYRPCNILLASLVLAALLSNVCERCCNVAIV